MNRITMHGKLACDAGLYNMKTERGEIPIVSFCLTDFGMPGQKNDPLMIEVHFARDVGIKLLPALKKEKEVLIDGFLTRKEYVTRSGEYRTKFYISASIVELLGDAMEEGVEAA